MKENMNKTIKIATANPTAESVKTTSETKNKPTPSINDGIKFAKSDQFRKELAEEALWRFDHGSKSPWIRPLEWGGDNRIWVITFWGKKPITQKSMRILLEDRIRHMIDMQCDSKKETRRLQDRTRLENMSLAHGEIAGREILIVQLRDKD